MDDTLDYIVIDDDNSTNSEEAAAPVALFPVVECVPSEPVFESDPELTSDRAPTRATPSVAAVDVSSCIGFPCGAGKSWAACMREFAVARAEHLPPPAHADDATTAWVCHMLCKHYVVYEIDTEGADMQAAAASQAIQVHFVNKCVLIRNLTTGDVSRLKVANLRRLGGMCAKKE